jgi:catechol 2,3-dioxygenase-like lactoylglutathione lyase family enzyme
VGALSCRWPDLVFSAGGVGGTRLIEASHFILYVADQQRSTAFYSAVLAIAPRLDVEGMTEFALPGGAVLGLMPEAGIEHLLGPALPKPSTARGVPRAELYLLVPEPAAYHARALAAGARELSALSLRSWGHAAAYSLDPDGHVLAFAVDESQSAT